MFSGLKDKMVVCRKQHRCEWCGEIVESGAQAHYRAYVFDGDFVTGYMHPECREAMDDYPDKRDLEDGWTEGDFKRGSTESW